MIPDTLAIAPYYIDALNWGKGCGRYVAWGVFEGPGDYASYTEQMAKQLCAAHGLLSPIYTTGTRGGCWFCPNCKIQHFVNLRRNHPELWAELVELSHTPNLCSYGFKYGLTVQEVEKRMNAEEQQLKLF